MAEGLGDFDLAVREHVNQLKRVDDALALEMIVRDDESGLRVFGHVFNSSSPGQKLLFGIEVVVALVAGQLGVVAEPGVLAAPVQADVAQRRSGALARFDRAADQRLVNVADSDVAFMQKRIKLGLGPGRMPHLNDKGVVVELPEDFLQAREIFSRVVKREREL